ncbi:MAG: RluA family pseudouridine synthase [Flammeovirgaceae bacterium]
MSHIESHVVPPQEKAIRLSDYVVGIFTAISSRQGMKKAIKKGWVRVNGEVASTARLLTGGEQIELQRVVTKPVKTLAMPLAVLYEDEYLAVIHKPAGMEVSGNRHRTIANALAFNLKKSTLPDALTQPHPAHRLDYPTSGVLLIGKTHTTLTALNQLFERKEIEKTYYAVTIGMMKPKGSINQAIDDKLAFTAFEVLDSMTSVKYTQLNLVKLLPKTGRRHQLRIHLATMGNPILGDKIYGQEGLIQHGNGLYLHAVSLTFTHPITHTRVVVKASLPKKFQKLFPKRAHL